MEYLEAAFTLGLPVMIMSWWVHSWLYRTNLIERRASIKETDNSIKEIRKSSKGDGDKIGDYWTNKWLRFGGGFYGLAALWTFIVIELQELWYVITNIGQVIDSLSAGFVIVAISFVKNQAMNLAQAFSWVVGWGNSGFSLIYFFSAYIGFYLGMKVAQVWDIREAIEKTKKVVTQPPS